MEQNIWLLRVRVCRLRKSVRKTSRFLGANLFQMKSLFVVFFEQQSKQKQRMKKSSPS